MKEKSKMLQTFPARFTHTFPLVFFLLFLLCFPSSALPDETSNPKVILISSILDHVDQLAAAVKDDVIALQYNPKTTDMAGLVKRVHTALKGGKASAIAIATHDRGEKGNDLVGVNAQSAVSKPNQTVEVQRKFPAEAVLNGSFQMEIAFVDDRLPDMAFFKQKLSDRMPVYKISRLEDGFKQVADILEKLESPVSTVHIFSHGAPGTILLGRRSIDCQIAEMQADHFKRIADNLDSDADILFYGCRIGEGRRGQSLLERLHQISGANIAASVDPTGHRTLNGNWRLEARAGIIDSDEIPLISAMKDYPFLLPTFDFTGVKASGGEASQTVSGVTLTVTSSGNNIIVADAGGGFTGTSGNVVYCHQPVDSMTFSFSKSVSITSLAGFDAMLEAGNWVLTPTGGSNPHRERGGFRKWKCDHGRLERRHLLYHNREKWRRNCFWRRQYHLYGHPHRLLLQINRGRR